LRIERNYHGVALPASEIDALQELERWLQQSGSLDAGQSIPLVQIEEIGRSESNIFCSIAKNTVIALSIRSCALATLPETLGNFINLRLLDIAHNQITRLPESLGN
jgi:Leucine-rich repeat (LRR) protein